MNRHERRKKQNEPELVQQLYNIIILLQKENTFLKTHIANFQEKEKRADMAMMDQLNALLVEQADLIRIIYCIKALVSVGLTYKTTISLYGEELHHLMQELINRYDRVVDIITVNGKLELQDTPATMMARQFRDAIVKALNPDRPDFDQGAELQHLTFDNDPIMQKVAANTIRMFDETIAQIVATREKQVKEEVTSDSNERIAQLTEHLKTVEQEKEQIEWDYIHKLAEKETQIAQIKADLEVANQAAIEAKPDTTTNTVKAQREIEKRIVAAVLKILNEKDQRYKTQVAATYRYHDLLDERFKHPDKLQPLEDAEKEEYWMLETEIDKAEKDPDHVAKWTSKLINKFADHDL